MSVRQGSRRVSSCDMGWDIVVAAIGGIISGAIGGWMARGTRDDRRVRSGDQNLAASEFARPSATTAAGDHPVAVSSSGDQSFNVGVANFGSRQGTAELGIEARMIGSHILVVVHNDGGTATARSVNFVYSPVGNDEEHTSRQVRAMGRLDDIPPKSQPVRLALMQPQVVSRRRKKRTFCVEWTNPDGSTQSIKKDV